MSMYPSKLVKFSSKYVKEGMVYVTFPGEYSDGSIAMQIYSEEGEPLCRPTTCLVEYGYKPSEGNVFIKTWSENEGVYEGLLKAGIIGEVVRKVPAGYAEAFECPLIL